MKAVINLCLSILIFPFFCYSQTNIDYKELNNFEDKKINSVNFTFPNDDEIDLIQNDIKDFGVTLDNNTKVLYKNIDNSHYSITLLDNKKGYLLDSLICKDYELKKIFLNRNIFEFIRKIEIENRKYFFIAYGSRSYNSTSPSSFIPIILCIDKNNIYLNRLKGFLYDVNDNLIINREKNKLFFMTYDLNLKKIYITSYNENFFQVKTINVNSIINDTNDNTIIISTTDFLKLRKYSKKY
jgi:hypothetical protein